MTHPPVLTKTDFIRRYLAGEFGNRCRTWDTLEAMLADGYQGATHVRSREPGGPGWYHVRQDELASLLKALNPTEYYLAEMGPSDSLRIFQGEVQRGLFGLDLYYTTVAKPMRDALREWCRQVSGITSLVLLRQFLCPASYEWLEYLLEEYSDHVVEFSTYSVEWGTVPGYNTVFWEVRKY